MSEPWPFGPTWRVLSGLERNFQIREMSRQALGGAYYAASPYDDVARAVQERTALLIVSGNVQYDRISRLPVELKAAHIQRMPNPSPTALGATRTKRGLRRIWGRSRLPK
jgi:hypothetical protein